MVYPARSLALTLAQADPFINRLRTGLRTGIRNGTGIDGAAHSRSKAALTRRSLSGPGGTQAAARTPVGAGLDDSARTGMLTSTSTGSAPVSCLPASSRAARLCHAGLVIAGWGPLGRRGPVR